MASFLANVTAFSSAVFRDNGVINRMNQNTLADVRISGVASPTLSICSFNYHAANNSSLLTDVQETFVQKCAAQEATLTIDSHVDLRNWISRHLCLRYMIEEVAREAFKNYCTEPDLINFMATQRASIVALEFYKSLAPIENQSISESLLPAFNLKTIVDGGPLPFIIFFTSEAFKGHGAVPSDHLQFFFDYQCPDWNQYLLNNPNVCFDIAAADLPDRNMQIEVSFALRSIAEFFLRPTKLSLEGAQRALRQLECETVYKELQFATPILGSLGMAYKQTKAWFLGKWNCGQMRKLLDTYHFLLKRPLFNPQEWSENPEKLTIEKRELLQRLQWQPASMTQNYERPSQSIVEDAIEAEAVVNAVQVVAIIDIQLDNVIQANDGVQPEVAVNDVQPEAAANGVQAAPVEALAWS